MKNLIRCGLVALLFFVLTGCASVGLQDEDQEDGSFSFPSIEASDVVVHTLSPISGFRSVKWGDGLAQVKSAFPQVEEYRGHNQKPRSPRMNDAYFLGDFLDQKCFHWFKFLDGKLFNVSIVCSKPDLDSARADWNDALQLFRMKYLAPSYVDTESEAVETPKVTWFDQSLNSVTITIQRLNDVPVLIFSYSDEEGRVLAAQIEERSLKDSI